MGAAMLDLSVLEGNPKASSRQLPQEMLPGAGTSTTSFALPQVQDVGFRSQCFPFEALAASLRCLRRLMHSKDKQWSVSSQHTELPRWASCSKAVL